MGISRLGIEILTAPDEARARLLAAFEASKGDRGLCAAAMSTTPRNLYRAFNRLRLWPQLDALSTKLGFEHAHGPPRARERLLAAVVDAKGNLKLAAKKLRMSDEVMVRRRIHLLELWDDLDRALARKNYPPLDRWIISKSKVA